MMAEPDTVEGEKLDILVILIGAYEAKHFPLDLPDPVEAIKFEREQKGLTVKDLELFLVKAFVFMKSSIISVYSRSK
ncbi:hypothetical protein [Methylophaga nitratireducenticrescens]|uniref:hypothetical protein n=1 Tax=Methylophaga nitratireducenticrescens TaxID=754476 RepID=UPI003CC8186D